jgi:hypothetical protein
MLLICCTSEDRICAEITIAALPVVTWLSSRFDRSTPSILSSPNTLALEPCDPEGESESTGFRYSRLP